MLYFITQRYHCLSKRGGGRPGYSVALHDSPLVARPVGRSSLGSDDVLEEPGRFDVGRYHHPGFPRAFLADPRNKPAFAPSIRTRLLAIGQRVTWRGFAAWAPR